MRQSIQKSRPIYYYMRAETDLEHIPGGGFKRPKHRYNIQRCTNTFSTSMLRVYPSTNYDRHTSDGIKAASLLCLILLHADLCLVVNKSVGLYI